ncbi:MAG: hypothetical protein LBC74_13775 [Planctomycetaceae bacterium]|nr:hypothetical protein [Planctomycetaceae bacterium]
MSKLGTGCGRGVTIGVNLGGKFGIVFWAGIVILRKCRFLMAGFAWICCDLFLGRRSGVF